MSQLDGEPFASHLPLLLERDAGPYGTSSATWPARTRTGRLTDATALLVFSGPHAYISPTWYEAEQVVPTWNYVAVHAYGTFDGSR